jgi:hypothetical protein
MARNSRKILDIVSICPLLLRRLYENRKPAERSEAESRRSKTMAISIRTIGTTSSSTHINKTNMSLWATQSMLSLVFLFAGSSKLLMSAEQMTSQSEMDIPVWFMRFIGVCEVAGALGLLLPSISRIRPGLTALAACGLVVIMVGATTLTAIAGPVAVALFPFFVGIGCAFVAYGRTHLAPIARR